VIVLLCAFLAVIGVNWPELPLGVRIADLVFIPLAVAVCSGPWRLTWHRSDTAVAIYLLAALPSIAISADPRHSAIELVRETYLAAIYVACAIVARRELEMFIAMGLALGGSLLSLLGLFFVALQFLGGSPWPAMGQVMTLPYLGDTLRLRALTASEAMFACLLTAAVPFAITSAVSYHLRKWWSWAAVMCAAAVLTFSHALAGFIVAIAVSLWSSVTAWPRRAATAIAIIAVLALNVAATVAIKSIDFGGARYADSSQYHYAIEERQAQIGNATVTYNVMSYFRIKQVAWRAFVEHPIAGVGLDQFHAETRRAFDEGRLTSAYREIDPHSTVPGRFAETGLIGGAALLFLWFVWGRMAIAGARSGPIGLATAAALAGLTVASLNADIMNFRFLWVIAGLMRGLQASTPSPEAAMSLSPGDQSES
jgi:hypothetical protein